MRVDRGAMDPACRPHPRPSSEAPRCPLPGGGLPRRPARRRSSANRHPPLITRLTSPPGRADAPPRAPPVHHDPSVAISLFQGPSFRSPPELPICAVYAGCALIVLARLRARENRGVPGATPRFGFRPLCAAAAIRTRRSLNVHATTRRKIPSSSTCGRRSESRSSHTLGDQRTIGWCRSVDALVGQRPAGERQILGHPGSLHVAVATRLDDRRAHRRHPTAHRPHVEGNAAPRPHRRPESGAAAIIVRLATLIAISSTNA
jgi:hypothetical protein